MEEKKKHLGLFWGMDSLYFVETTGTAVTLQFSVPYKYNETKQADGETMFPEGMQIISNIQDALRQHGLQSSAINLSLPIKDIIFRSFVIPWMGAHEVKGVVDFEVSKYVPFALDELSYSYHPMTITTEGAKRIRIIFVAIKKDALDYYTNILDRSDLQADVIEPAPLSLIRSLSLHKLLGEKAAAIIEHEGEAGKIIIVNQGIPQFVRDFQLKGTTGGAEEASPQDADMRLINEIRISLDYFSRQDTQLKVEQILLTASSASDELVKRLAEDWQTPVKAVNSTHFLGKKSPPDVGFINAFGAGLVHTVSSPVTFNLAKKKAVATVSRAEMKIDINFKPIVVIGLVCALFIGLSFLLKEQMVGQHKKKVAALKQALGSSKDLSTKSLKTKASDLTLKLNNFQEIRTENHISLFLSAVPNLLPEGTWIENISIGYPTKKKDKKKKADKETINPNIQLSGYAYSENTNEQVLLVNRLLRNLKNHEEFKELFDDIDLEAVNAQRLGEYNVSSFRIRLQ